MRKVLLALTLMTALVGCVTPSSTVSSMRLPTRIPPTPTLSPTPTVVSIGAWAYYKEGLARREAGDVKGALQSFTWAIEQSTDFVSPYVARGAIYLLEGELRLALADANAAIDVNPSSAAAYALRGEVLRQIGHPLQAIEDFDQATGLDPDLTSEIFDSYWQVAWQTDRAVRMLTLSRAYGDAHPNDPLRYYYRGWAFIALDSPHSAIKALVRGIETVPNPPALLWFTLGQAYAKAGLWQDAVTSFEATRALVQAGDISLSTHSERPIVDLFIALGRAYQGAERCADAETMLEYAIEIGAPTAEVSATLKQARICRTPTPEPTPYPTTTPG